MVMVLPASCPISQLRMPNAVIPNLVRVQALQLDIEEVLEHQPANADEIEVLTTTPSPGVSQTDGVHHVGTVVAIAQVDDDVRIRGVEVCRNSSHCHTSPCTLCVAVVEKRLMSDLMRTSMDLRSDLHKLRNWRIGSAGFRLTDTCSKKLACCVRLVIADW
jgi:hypothetical protein